MLALVAQVVFTFRDETDSQSQVRLYVRSTSSPDAVLSAASGLAAHMQAISSCVVDEITVTYREIITPSGNPTQPANPYGVFLFDTTTPEAYFIATIPGLRSELLKLPPDDIHIDVEQADVAAFINYITGSLFVNPFANIIASIDEAYIQHRIHSGRYIP